MSLFKKQVEEKSFKKERKEEIRIILTKILRENEADICKLIHPLTTPLSCYLGKGKLVDPNDYGSEMIIIRREYDHSFEIVEEEDGFSFNYTLISRGGGVRPPSVLSRKKLNYIFYRDSDTQIKEAFEKALIAYVSTF